MHTSIILFAFFRVPGELWEFLAESRGRQAPAGGRRRPWGGGGGGFPRTLESGRRPGPTRPGTKYPAGESLTSIISELDQTGPEHVMVFIPA